MENDKNEINILTDEEVERLYYDVLENGQSVLIAKCAYNYYVYNGYTQVCNPKPSDIRLKYIESESVAGLKEINKLKIYNYKYKNDKTNAAQVGVIAQELQEVFPNSVKVDLSGYLYINREEMFYAMINAIKELSIRVEALEKNKSL